MQTLAATTLQTTNDPKPIRGEVWWVDFNPAQGDEADKIRPAIVVSSDGLKGLRIKLVVPLNTHAVTKPWHVEIVPDAYNGLRNVGVADALNLRAVSVNRFKEKLGRIRADELEQIAVAIGLVIDYPSSS